MTELSIITINYNNLPGLKKTVESVLSQDFKDFDYYIIDGGSTDGSKEFIEKNKDKFTYHVSEKDAGIYNAMNKGIQKATGKYLLFLNSGDYFVSEDSVSKILKSSNNEDIIYGNFSILEENGKQWTLEYPSKLTFGHFYHTGLPHQATLIKRALFEKFGLYNENYKILADWEFFVNALCRYNCTYKHVNEPIAVFEMGGLSNHPDSKDLFSQERKTILRKEYNMFVDEYEEYFKIKNEWNNYRNSRLHQMVQKLINSSFYKNTFKKFIKS